MNPIFKRVVRQSHSFNEGRCVSRKEWVARCPKCNKIITAGMSIGIYGIAENSRKTAKDALYRHLKFNHNK